MNSMVEELHLSEVDICVCAYTHDSPWFKILIFNKQACVFSRVFACGFINLFLLLSCAFEFPKEF